MLSNCSTRTGCHHSGVIIKSYIASFFSPFIFHLVCHKCILKSQCRYQIPEDWPYQKARRLFKEPMVSVDIPELKWTSPDEEVKDVVLDYVTHYWSYLNKTNLF